MAETFEKIVEFPTLKDQELEDDTLENPALKTLGFAPYQKKGTITATVSLQGAFAHGSTTRATGTTPATTTIAHGLGVIPSRVHIISSQKYGAAGAEIIIWCTGDAYATDDERSITWAIEGSGTADKKRIANSTSLIVNMFDSGGVDRGTANLSTLDATNIILTWDSEVFGGTITLWWEAFK